MSMQPKGAKVWDQLFSKCLEKRTSFSEFKVLVEDASRQTPVAGRVCIRSLMRQDRPAILDPRLISYIEILLQSGTVDIPDVLEYVLQMFMKSSIDEGVISLTVQHGRKSYEAAIMNLLTHEISVDDRKLTSDSGRIKLVYILKPFASWLSFFSQTFNDAAPLSGPQLDVADAFGQFAVSYINKLSLSGILDHGAPKSMQLSIVADKSYVEADASQNFERSLDSISHHS